MKYYYDFHIHSALSPCGDNDMTPNNIVNMAMVKGLDIIAVTDHNSAENIEAIMERGRARDMIVIPGMEIESAEEVHMVCLFPDVESVRAMQEKVSAALPTIQNREDVFGEQLIINAKDEQVGKVSQMLITATGMSVEEIFEEVRGLGGVCFPAHVDRDSYSILSNLGAIPEDLDIDMIEISSKCDQTEFLERHPELKKYRTVVSSDAHYLWDISERTNFFEADEKLTDAKSVLMLFDRKVE